jgi:Zn-dependent protease
VLLEPGRTAYDVAFRLFGFPVRIHPFFWLFSALLGSDLLVLGPLYLAIWIAIVFASILVHEMGHALAFRRYGRDARIVLYSFGGLAIPNALVLGRTHRIIVALAGPFAGFLLAGAVYGSDRLTHWSSENGSYARAAYLMLFSINVTWGILNLMPVFPLDGGQVSQELCEARWPGRGQRIGLQISFWAAIAIATYCGLCEYELRTGKLQILNYVPIILIGSTYTAILFLFLAFQSYRLLQQIGRGPHTYYEAPDDRVPWER